MQSRGSSQIYKPLQLNFQTTKQQTACNTCEQRAVTPETAKVNFYKMCKCVAIDYVTSPCGKAE